jgi:metal-responsive CopG/Arc/MetJ family transcriptional regulator
MRIKTSITLSEHLLTEIDRLSGKGGNRSAVIERALREFIGSQARRRRDARDLKSLNKQAGRLKHEAMEVLAYQVDV